MTKLFLGLLLLGVSLLPLAGLAENVISKSDADSIFSMRKAEWEKNAPKYAYPNWNMKLKVMDTGTVVMGVDQASGMALTIQPFFMDDKSHPASLLVGSYYPSGTVTADIPTMEKEIASDSAKDLGPKYKVTAKYVKLNTSIEGVELTLRLANPK